MILSKSDSSPVDEYVAAFVADIDCGRVFTAQTVASEPSIMQLDGIRPVTRSRRWKTRTAMLFSSWMATRFAGVVTYQQAAAADRDSGPADVPLADVIVTDFPTTDPDTQFADLYGPAGSRITAIWSRDGWKQQRQPDSLKAGVRTGLSHAP